MEHSYGEYLHSTYIYRFVRTHGEEVDGWHSRVALLQRREAVWDAFEEVVGTELLGIDIDIAEDAVWAQVVESTHMVVVLMGDEYGIEAAKLHAEHLLTEVGTAVDEYAAVIDIDEGAATQAFVAWVCAGACGTGATYLWDST